MANTAVQRFYRYHARVYDITRWMFLHGRRQAVGRLELKPDSSVLEVGCGTGLNFRFILEHLDPRLGRLVGLDFSEDMLRQARRRVAAMEWSNVELVYGDATQMKFDKSFDAVLFAYSLAMIPDWPAVLERAYEHLQPGGRLVVLDFGTFDGWGPLASLIGGCLRLHHVDTHKTYVQKLRDMFPGLGVRSWLRGYYFTAVGKRGADRPGCGDDLCGHWRNPKNDPHV